MWSCISKFKFHFSVKFPYEFYFIALLCITHCIGTSYEADVAVYTRASMKMSFYVNALLRVCIAVATVIVTSLQTQNVTAGRSFTLTCNATGFPVPSIEWTLNGISYTGSTSITIITLANGLQSNTSSITVTDAMANDTGVYECMATNIVNTDTQNANVTVQS